MAPPPQVHFLIASPAALGFPVLGQFSFPEESALNCHLTISTLLTHSAVSSTNSCSPGTFRESCNDWPADSISECSEEPVASSNLAKSLPGSTVEIDRGFLPAPLRFQPGGPAQAGEPSGTESPLTLLVNSSQLCA